MNMQVHIQSTIILSKTVCIVLPTVRGKSRCSKVQRIYFETFIESKSFGAHKFKSVSRSLEDPGAHAWLPANCAVSKGLYSQTEICVVLC